MAVQPSSFHLQETIVTDICHACSRVSLLWRHPLRPPAHDVSFKVAGIARGAPSPAPASHVALHPDRPVLRVACHPPRRASRVARHPRRPVLRVACHPKRRPRVYRVIPAPSPARGVSSPRRPRVYRVILGSQSCAWRVPPRRASRVARQPERPVLRVACPPKRRPRAWRVIQNAQSCAWRVTQSAGLARSASSRVPSPARGAPASSVVRHPPRPVLRVACHPERPATIARTRLK